MSAFLFLGGAGFYWINHKCHETGRNRSLYVDFNNHCEEEQQASTCCSKMTHAESSDCCSHEVEVFQVKLDHCQDLSIELKFIDFTVEPVFVFTSPKAYDSPNAGKKIVRPPPQPSGREITIRYQQFLC